MNLTTITFLPGGDGHCLYTEAIDLQAIGALEIRRATNIEFCDRTQQWEVRHAQTNSLLFQDASRQVCVAWEYENLQ